MFCVVFQPFHPTLVLPGTKDFSATLSSYCSIQTHLNINARIIAKVYARVFLLMNRYHYALGMLRLLDE